MYRGKRKKAVAWDKRVTAAAAVGAIAAVLTGQIVLSRYETAAGEAMTLEHSRPRTEVRDEPVILLSAVAAQETGRLPGDDIPASGYAALTAWGRFREDVPLDPVMQDITRAVCGQYGVDYALVLGVMDVESDFNIEAVNAVSGCYGLMQLNPAYFPADMTPGENIRAGIAFLAEQIERYEGDIPAALCAYNAGHDTGSRVYAGQVQAEAEKWAAVLEEEVKEQ